MVTRTPSSQNTNLLFLVFEVASTKGCTCWSWIYFVPTRCLQGAFPCLFPPPSSPPPSHLSAGFRIQSPEGWPGTPASAANMPPFSSKRTGGFFSFEWSEVSEQYIHVLFSSFCWILCVQVRKFTPFLISAKLSSTVSRIIFFHIFLSLGKTEASEFVCLFCTFCFLRSL